MAFVILQSCSVSWVIVAQIQLSQVGGAFCEGRGQETTTPLRNQATGKSATDNQSTKASVTVVFFVCVCFFFKLKKKIRQEELTDSRDTYI